MIPHYSEFNEKSHILDPCKLVDWQEGMKKKWELTKYLYCLFAHTLHGHLRECFLLMTPRKYKRSNFNLQTGPKEQGKSLSSYSLG